MSEDLIMAAWSLNSGRIYYDWYNNIDEVIRADERKRSVLLLHVLIS